MGARKLRLLRAQRREWHDCNIAVAVGATSSYEHDKGGRLTGALDIDPVAQFAQRSDGLGYGLGAAELDLHGCPAAAAAVGGDDVYFVPVSISEVRE